MDSNQVLKKKLAFKNKFQQFQTSQLGEGKKTKRADRNTGLGSNKAAGSRNYNYSSAATKQDHVDNSSFEKVRPPSVFDKKQKFTALSVERTAYTTVSNHDHKMPSSGPHPLALSSMDD